MEKAEIKNLFEFHAPEEGMNDKFAAVREAIINAAVVIDTVCPPSADRTAAIRKLKEAQMTANSSIVLKGASYK